MKNLKSLFSFCILLIASYGMSAQYAVVMASTPTAKRAIVEHVVEQPQIDKTAVKELSAYLAENVAFPFEELSYLNKVSVTLQVSLNSEGKVIDSRIVSSSHPQAGDNVLNALKNEPTFTPISVNGVPSTRTLQIPLIFR